MCVIHDCIVIACHHCFIDIALPKAQKLLSVAFEAVNQSDISPRRLMTSPTREDKLSIRHEMVDWFSFAHSVFNNSSNCGGPHQAEVSDEHCACLAW